MTFIIHNGKRPLSYFFPNGNGKVKDIIGFSDKSYFGFNDKKEAENRIQYMKDEIRKREDFDLRLHLNLFKVFDKLKISEVTQ